GGIQPASGIPEIIFIDFPKLIPSDGSQVIGTLGFRDPDANIVSVDFTVVKAVTFPPFSFNPNVKGKVDGIFQFLIFSQLGQQVTLQVTLLDEQGNKSPPQQFSFIAGKRITSRTAFLGQWGRFGLDGGQFDLPRAVAVDLAGNVYVVDTGNHRIQKFSPNQQLLAEWGSHCDLLQNSGCTDPDGEGPLEVGDGQFALPQGIAVDKAGNVYVSDFGNARIEKFDASGAFLMKWGRRGNGEGQFNQPIGVAIDEEGNVYVSDSGNDRVQKFDAAGSFLMKWGSFGAGDGQFHDPRGLALDSNGYVYVVDSGNHRVQKFSLSGAFLKKWGIPGRGDGELFLPFGVAVDSVGNVYVTDTLNHRIQKFDAGGNFITTWGGLGQDEGLFNNPTGIAVDVDGNIYVTDSVNSRLQKFVGLE
ncbi:MAG: hypothetical protein A2Z21_10255, partial [Candidatus Fraserbacteria bacterium RBG_16_55_9]